MDKFRWCFIGTGKLAKQVASQLEKSGRHKIVSCYTRNYDNAVQFANRFGGTAYRDPESAINHEGVEGVYIVTTHNAHFRYAKIALENGKPVFCEKAFTVTAAETDELIRIAKENDVYLCEAMWTWFSPSANKVKEWISQNKIGRIKNASFTYHIRSVGYAERILDPKRAGGALLDITVYPITYAYRLWGMPEKIESKAVMKNGIDLGEDIIFTYKDFKVYISASIVDYKGLEKMSIKGENGTIKANFYHALNGVTCQKGLFKKEIFKGNGPKFNSYLDEFNAVACDIRMGRKESEFVPLKATFDVMRLLDTIRDQINLVYDELE